MGDVTKLRLAPAVVLFDNVDVGYTSFSSPIEINDTPKEVGVKAAQTGDTDIDAFSTGHSSEVSVPLVEVTPDKLLIAIPNAVSVGGVVTVKLRIGQSQRALAKRLQVIRLVDGVPSTNPDDMFTFPEVSPKAGTVKQAFDANKQQELTAVFRAWPDPVTGEFYHVGP